MRRSERLPPKVTFWRVIFAEYVRFDRAKAIKAYTVLIMRSACDFGVSPKVIGRC